MKGPLFVVLLATLVSGLYNDYRVGAGIFDVRVFVFLFFCFLFFFFFFFSGFSSLELCR